MRRPAALLGALAMVIGLAGVATAALKESSAEFTLDAHASTEATVTCDTGAAAAGGFDFRGSTSVFAGDSARDGKSVWRVSAVSSEDQPKTATAYVYCDRRAKKLKQKSASETVDAMDVGAITARCKRGQEAVSGGLDTPADSLGHTNLIGSHRVGKRKWTVTAFNASVQPETYAAFAYCDKTEPRLKTQSESVTVDSPFGESVAASCKGKQRLRSGGFQVEYVTGADRGRITASHQAGKREWEAAARILGETPDLTAYAYCKKKRKRK